MEKRGYGDRVQRWPLSEVERRGSTQPNWTSLKSQRLVFANALRTSDCEIPNCRAILDGVMPALKAARTAFNFPCVKGTAITSIHRLGKPSSEFGRFLPRRFCSASTAENNWSSSLSSSCLIAFVRSLGRTYRRRGAAVVREPRGNGEEGSRADAVENKSRVDG